ncbi:MAG: M28 family peptidase [Cytophagales bacterium]|nr:M28 family peptidase [Cytophagales bacterium]MCA6368577.1 M28 family peptidase [Cytophagales bacterium]MCA6370261.1 M28 family peptidase [Cytophagales bacterium]MCA6374600.1 M28 family peptidase [Cytophagales bacterium]MCA6385071.1 M28 family peptidase [Cytophagales bacterium]
MSKKSLLLFCLALLALIGQAQVNSTLIRSHIKILSSDSLEGRGTGTAGEKLAIAYIQSQWNKIGLLPKGDGKLFTQKFTFKGGIHGTGEEGTAYNLVGFIDNQAANTIVIGAHFDHLGLGNQGSSLDANPQNKIHNGADDNASGVAGVIELARYFQMNKIKESTNFLFICFSGEELGLYGSKYFTENPTIDLTKVNYMINMDMIGRLDPQSKNLAVSGTGTSAAWEPLLKKLSSEKLLIKTDSAGVGPSDHTSFYLKNIPVLHFFTGSHSDYHKPSDDAEKINYEGEKEILELIIRLVENLDKQPKLTFLATKNKSMGSARAFKVTMGVMPSYTSSEEGLKVDGVTEGKPAQKAGIAAGDVIVQIASYQIKDIQSYMDALGKFEKGQVVPVKLKREKEIITLNVTF